MKLTKEQLKRIIKEEIQKVKARRLNEEDKDIDFAEIGEEAQGAAEELGDQISDLIFKKAEEIAKATGDEGMVGAIEKVIQAAVSAAD